MTDMVKKTIVIQVSQVGVAEFASSMNKLSVIAEQVGTKVSLLSTRIKDLLATVKGGSIGKLTASMKSANAEISSLKANVASLKAQIRKTTGKTNTMDKTFKTAGGTIHSTNRALHFFRTALTTIGFTLFLKLIRETIDEFIELRSRVLLTADSLEDYNESLEGMFRISNEVRASIGSMSKLFNKFHISLKPFGATIAQSTALVKALGQSIKISGSNTAEQKAFYIQFGQAIQSGILRGREFRSMMESNLYMSRLLATELAGGDLGKLRKLAFSAQLDTLTVTNAILKNQSKINKAFSRVGITISDMFILIKNELVDVMMEWEKSIGQSKLFIGTLEAVRDNLRQIIVGVGVFIGSTMVQLLFQFGLLVKIIRGAGIGLLIYGIIKLYKESKGFRDLIQSAVEYWEDLFAGVTEVDTVMGKLVKHAEDFIGVFDGKFVEMFFVELKYELIAIATIIDTIIRPLGRGGLGLTLADTLGAMMSPPTERMAEASQKTNLFKDFTSKMRDEMESKTGEIAGNILKESTLQFENMGTGKLLFGLLEDRDIPRTIQGLNKLEEKYTEILELAKNKIVSGVTYTPVQIVNMTADIELYKGKLKQVRDTGDEIRRAVEAAPEIASYEKALKAQARGIAKLFTPTDVKEMTKFYSAFETEYERFLNVIGVFQGETTKGVQDKIKELRNEIMKSPESLDISPSTNKLIKELDKWRQACDEELSKIKFTVKAGKEEIKKEIEEIKTEPIQSGLFLKYFDALLAETDLTWTPELKIKPKRIAMESMMSLEGFSDRLEPIITENSKIVENVLKQELELYSKYYSKLEELRKMDNDFAVQYSKTELPKTEIAKRKELQKTIDFYDESLNTLKSLPSDQGITAKDFYPTVPLDDLKRRIKEAVIILNESDIDFFLGHLITVATDADASIESTIITIEEMFKGKDIFEGLKDFVAIGGKFDIKTDFYGKAKNVSDLSIEMINEIKTQYREVFAGLNQDAGKIEKRLVAIANIELYKREQEMTPADRFGEGVLTGFKTLYKEYADIIGKINGLTTQIFDNFAEEANKFFLGITESWREFAQNTLKIISDTMFKMLLYGEGGLMPAIMNKLDIGGFKKPNINEALNREDALLPLLSGATGAGASLSTIPVSVGFVNGAFTSLTASAYSASFALASVSATGTAEAGATFLEGAFELSASASGRQFGGNTNANEPMWVGESGRELFIPDQKGHIYNNSNSESKNKSNAGKSTDVTIMNYTDKNQYLSALNSPRGRRAIVNIVGQEYRKNRG